jgi:hypothetical protein
MKWKHTLFVCSLSALTAVVSFAALFFLFHVIKNKNEHTSAVLSTLDEKITEKENADVFAKKIADIEATDTALSSHFVDSKKISTFVDYLENYGTQTNTEVTVTDISISDKDKNTIAVKLSIIGEFKDVLQTIALLENDQYQIHITSSFVNRQISTVVPVPGAPVKPPTDMK